MSRRSYRLLGAVLLARALPAAAQLATAQQWDPTVTRGATRTIEFTVSEGTFESVDISPDGRWVLFDLLGHIYRVSAGGGSAECLTQSSGAALNYHPRYSPDGSTIAFVSDRGGQDNLWVMDADGSRPRPVFLDLRSRIRQPAWAPDGKSLIAVRVFPTVLDWEFHRTTIARFPLARGAPKELLASLGAQYYWPAPSRDGRYLYFYQSGMIRELDGLTKDQRLGRLELASGTVRDLTPTLPGGIFRADQVVEFGPEISPDGRWLAFGRRIPGGTVEIRGHTYGVRTALWVRDLATGAERVVMDPIESDATQGNAVRHMKAIPGYRWASDGLSIVIPQGGKIRRVWLDSGKIETIAFTATVRRQISETARSRFRVTDDSIRSTFIRWPATSRDGNRFVFEAIGRLWLRNGLTADPRPITDTRRGFALTPAWSPDGRWIAFATWHDESGGRLWKMPAEGGSPVPLVEAPGQYFYPTWSADGRWVYFQQGGWGNRNDQTWWNVARVGAEGGPVTVLAESPEAVPISLTALGAFFPVRQSKGDLAAFSRHGEIPLNRWRLTPAGAAKKAFTGPVPGEAAAVSPDGRWVAFVDRLDLYLASTDLLRSTALTKTSPGVRRLTRRGGLYPKWIDAGRLEWVSGDRHYVFEVSGGRVDSTVLVARWPRAVGARTIALTGARILTMAGRRIIDRGAVIVKGSRITCVGECDRAGADTVIDLAGKTVMPGLVDTHAHFLRGSPAISPHQHEPARYLAYGVTTTIDPASLADPGFPTAELIEAGEVVGPRTFSSGDPLDGYGPISDILSWRDAQDHVGRLAAWGAIEIKNYHQPTRIARQMIARAGREVGITVTAEGEDLVRNLALIIDGHPGWEHNLPYTPLYRDAVEFFGRAGIVYSATLNVSSPQLRGQEYHQVRSGIWDDPKEQRFTPWRERLQSRYWMVRPESEYAFPLLAEGLADIVHAGGRGAIGGHGEWYGLDTHWELWSAATALPPMEALELATWQGASYYGLDRDIGTLEPGKVADLIVLDADPLVDIHNSRSVRLVMKGGQLFEAATLDRIWPEARPFRTQP